MAAAVAALATGLAGGRAAPVAPAGGTPDGGLGTSSELIAEAAASVDEGAGVAVLVDLGSAVLTVKALLAEGDELPDATRLIDAPFLEGAVAAVVTASAGATWTRWRPRPRRRTATGRCEPRPHARGRGGRSAPQEWQGPDGAPSVGLVVVHFLPTET